MVNKRKGADSKKPKAESKPGKIRKNKPTKTNKKRLLTALCLTKHVNNSRSPSLHNEKEMSVRILSSSPEQACAIAETTFEGSFIITDVSGMKHLSLNHSIATSSPKT
uniref:Uncharacterized protein n=1 Tax=Amphimedon queenslandica TaxID=400682 RepID=A0A1X7TPU8_AMPQE